MKKEIINKSGGNTIVTVGMFDGLHVGHQHILQLLLRQSQALKLTPVIVTFDNHPRLVLNNDIADFSILTTLKERMDLIQQSGIERIEVIHFTQEIAQLSACQFVRQYLVEKFHMSALLLGYDNMFGNKKSNNFDCIPALATELGFRIIEDTAIKVDNIEVSSTRIRKALLMGNIELANLMLGTTYSVVGIVEHGHQIGRTLGFPTANIRLQDSNKALPCEGVYAVKVSLVTETKKNSEKVNRWAMANLGQQPTFGGEKHTFEVHLLNDCEDLYGKILRVSFVSRLRNIRKFDTPEDLIAQLKMDKEEVEEHFMLS